MTDDSNRVIIGIDGFDVAADNLLQGVQVTGYAGHTRSFSGSTMNTPKDFFSISVCDIARYIPFKLCFVHNQQYDFLRRNGGILRLNIKKRLKAIYMY